MEKLKQNNLEQSTTDLGFLKVVNSNANELGTDKATLVKEITLEDGVKVDIEGITPHKMKSILNQQITASGSDSKITFKTPGEIVETTNGILDGVVQIYNKELESNKTIQINVDVPSNDIDLLGKTVDDLQSNIVISDNLVSGNINYVTDYIGFSSNVDEQSGNYLVIHVEAEEASSITCELTESLSGKGPVLLDSDGLFIARLTNSNGSTTQKINIVTTVDGNSTTKILDLTNLVLANS